MNPHNKQTTPRTSLSEVSLRITGTLDLGVALREAHRFLLDEMPLDTLLLIRFDETDPTAFRVMRVTEDGLTDTNTPPISLDLDAAVSILSDARGTGAVLLSELRSARSDSDKGHPSLNIELPSPFDACALFFVRSRSALVAVSYRENSYARSHAMLLESLWPPLDTALSNSAAFEAIQRMRDKVTDDHRLFREVTVRLTGEIDIGKAFQNTLKYLKQFMPLSQIVLVSIAESPTNQRILMRVTDKEIVDDADALLFLGDQENLRSKLFEDLPDTFVRELMDDDFYFMSEADIERNVKILGAADDAPLILIGAREIFSGILFILDSTEPSAVDRTLSVLEMLKEPFTIALYNAIRFYEIERLKDRLEEDNRALQRDIQRDVGERIVGMDQGLKHIMALAGQVAKTPSPVLLQGETGSGKEVIATAIHRMSDRAAGPFISINCGAISESLIDSELFGHERGAFTGANERKRGRFERAEKGTLFLDEIGELPLSAQVRLLRVLQEKEFERVGGGQVVRADVRLIAATNRNLPAMVRDGLFREDLWFRLNVFPLEIPPLRERRGDIPALAYHFIETKCRQLNLSFRPALPANSLEQLITYDWPGNVRELQNAIERALILSHGAPLTFPHLPRKTEKSAGVLPPRITEPFASQSLPTYDEISTEYFQAVLKATNGIIGGPRGAARITGLHPSTFRSKIKKLGISATTISKTS
jgi:transcriptional regulator with GAF, ATPase, and Fis domain